MKKKKAIEFLLAHAICNEFLGSRSDCEKYCPYWKNDEWCEYVDDKRKLIKAINTVRPCFNKMED